MTSKKRERATSKASKTGGGRTEGSRRKLAEAFLADLDRSWERSGGEILDRLIAERPVVFFKAITKLTLVLHRTLRKPNNFDRQRNREEVLQRLEERRNQWDNVKNTHWDAMGR
jgi:hypothetical protein